MAAKKKSNRPQARIGRRNVPLISHIGLDNFKGFKKTGLLPLKELTFLVGANSSGKSSLLKALAAFSQTANSVPRSKSRELDAHGGLVDIGVYDDITNVSEKEFELS